MKSGKVAVAVAILLGWTWAATAQRLDPVKWTLAVEPSSAPPGSKVLAHLTAKIDPGWHLYSLSTPKGGPIPTTIRVLDNPAVEGFRVHQPPPVRAFDPNFKLDTETYENETTFLLEVQLKKDAPAGEVELTAQARYQACDAKQCLLPVRRTASATLIVDPAASAAGVLIPPAYTLFDPSQPAVEPPVPAETRTTGAEEVQGMGMFVLIAFGFGLAAIFTPCVFPMIPITVSFFLNKQPGSKSQSVVQAAVFCLGIIVLFSSLGLLTTALLGPFGAQQLASSPWVNGFVALVFLVFSLSLLGAFEITIPPGVLTRLDRASQGGGVVGTLIMGLTFSLAAFACVGPFVGTLLAGSLQSGGARPLVGMTSFATGLAAPFFFLALFPSYLRRLPKSGGWMARVKVVLGFVILAAMLKYLSNIDAVMQWNFLTRERYLAAWVVLFALPAFYLLGFLRMEGASPEDKIGIWRLLIGTAFLVFAISLVPGMFGGKLGEIDAYVPLPSGRTMLGSPSASGEKLVWMKNQYKEALEKGRAEDKLIFLNFTGYACTNCHWMKSNMFPRPEIAEALGNYILVELYTDGTDAASEVNQQILEQKFATSAIPYYAIVDPNEKVIATFPGLTRNAEEFLAFLKLGETVEVASSI